MIPESVITDIKHATDIVQVVSETVQMKKTGSNFAGLCPFHSEKTPSFTVSPTKQIYYCFGCGAGGSVFNFVMKRDGLTFPETVRALGSRCGIEVPERALSPEEKEKIGAREKIFLANRLAADFFTQTLKGSVGTQALAYLRNRGISEETMERFGLGYAPDSWDAVSQCLSSHRVPVDIAVNSGLLIAKEETGRFYDRFRNRIVFPIVDTAMQVSGFGGRVMDDALPKYLNSPETPVYHKARSLYGLHAAREGIRQSGMAFVVEGYFDVLALFQHGITQATATLGTALTRDHVRLLSRCGAERFVLVFDSDQAGIRAALRSVPVFQKEYMTAKVLVLPTGHDPDSFVRESGPEAFLSMAENAMDLLEFLMDASIRRHGLSVEGRLKVLADMKEPLLALEDRVARSLYIRVLADKVGIDEGAVSEKIHQDPGAGHRYSGPGSQSDRPERPVGRIPTGNSLELQIVSMLVRYAGIHAYCRDVGITDYFEDPGLKGLCSTALAYDGPPEAMTDWLLMNLREEGQREWVARLAIDEFPVIHQRCVALIDQYVRNRNRLGDDLSKRIREAEVHGDHVLLLALLEEKRRFSQDLKRRHDEAKKVKHQSGVAGGKTI
ncbi:DNA primase [Desulfoluna sp.]|uniref:DNA primase n=1 Tax=Desulfoluna sp. TaxID=2045199 RepID=UPI002619042B|nr:DNA primase [Desulfoluna sp.]